MNAETDMPTMPFAVQEYRQRLDRVRRRMADASIDALVLSDPCNIYYLTGYDGWSFYTPQVVIVFHDRDPVWLGRAMDVTGVNMLAWMNPDCVISYPDHLVQSSDGHPYQQLAAFLKDSLPANARIGVEKQNYYLTVDAYELLLSLCESMTLCDASLMVNWVRFVKSPAELEVMQQAAMLLDRSMEAAFEVAEPGVRESDIAAAIYAANCKGDGEIGGVYTSSPAFILPGERTATPHLSWSDQRIAKDSALNLELMGNRLRYQVTMARTVYFGTPPDALRWLESIVLEGIQETLAFIRPGVSCEEVEGVWRRAIARHGISKESRCGYSLGITYPPTGGELTASLRPGDKTVLEQGVVMHFLPALWDKELSLTISEPVRVTATGCERLSAIPTQLIVK